MQDRLGNFPAGESVAQRDLDMHAELFRLPHRRQNAQVVTRSYALTYDARDRVTTATDAFGKTVSYQYDAANNLKNFTDAAGRPTAYTYDAHNRLQTATLTASPDLTR